MRHVKLANLAIVAALVLSAGATMANTLTINSVSGIWTNILPAAGISGGGTNNITWGSGSGQPNPSGYLFVGATPPPFVANEAVNFSLGTFTHQNNPITGTTLASADLKVSVDVAGYGIINSVFSFAHLETPNGANPCADVGPNGVGVNINGCADRVQATLNLGASDSFQIGGVDYVFDVSGFFVGGSLLTDFWTTENAHNDAELLGRFVTRDSKVPLPAAGWLLISGVGGLATMSRKKKKAA